MTEILVGEAARILKLSANHVRYLERTGQLPCRRIGIVRVFDRDVVVKLAEERLRLATGQHKWRDQAG
jgi:DNA-binding transcriptional MerR regulator